MINGPGAEEEGERNRRADHHNVASGVFCFFFVVVVVDVLASVFLLPFVVPSKLQ